MNATDLHPALRVCLDCGFTYAEFQARGLLGCASCYGYFGDALTADLLQMHPRFHRIAPGACDRGRDAVDRASRTAALRERLSDALRLERYEDAAALQRRLDALLGGPRAGEATRSSVPGVP